MGVFPELTRPVMEVETPQEVEVKPPFALLDFQLKDVAKLARVEAGAIGSEMGTGKTHEGIALYDLWGCKERPSLVVAPINTHKSWYDKFKMQSPETRVHIVDRKNRDDFTMAVLADVADVYIIHWQALRLMPELQKIEWQVIIGDEVHRISNQDSKVTAAFKKLKAHYRLAMSGTMSGDKPDKMWSVLNWLYPMEFRSYWGFRRDYLIESVGWGGYRTIIGVKNVEHLHERIAPFFIRHLKKERCCEEHPEGVMSYLPDKTYDVIEVVLNPTQRRIYDQMATQMVSWIGAHQDTPLMANVVIAQLTRLSQMCLATPKIVPKTVRRRNPNYGDPSMPEMYTKDEWIYEQKADVILEAPSEKIDRVKELINDNPEKSFVVFSSSKQACYLAELEFAKAGITSRVLSGDTSQKDRDTIVEEFQSRAFQVFIGVIAAAGEGIDGLQDVCDTAIFLDRSWSALENKQAEDRLHREGQTESVQIIDVVAIDTVEMGKIQRVNLKWGWLREILGDNQK